MQETFSRALLACTLLGACAEGPQRQGAGRTGDSTGSVDSSVASAPPGDNVLIFLLDDVGVDKVAAYGLAPDAPPMPVFESLAAEGVLFEHAYASPMCSPTRANLVTGRYPRRTGIGGLVELSNAYELPREELGLGELVSYSPLPYTSSMAGKWHLGVNSPTSDVATHPRDFGFDWFAGSLENLGVSVTNMGNKGYWNWEKNDNGVLGPTKAYATADTTGDAIARIAAMPEPWLLYVAFNAAHEPWHTPPEGYTDVPVGQDPTLSERYAAMLNSTDKQIGVVLDAMPPEVRARTTIMVMGDNGTANQVITPPFDPAREKGTLYEGGVHVPLVVASPHVTSPGSTSAAFVHAVDVFATVAELAGVPLDGPGAPPFAGPIDGISLVPYLEDPGLASLREYAFAEGFEPNGMVEPRSQRQMMRDGEWKYLRRTDASGVVESLYHFEPGSLDEGPDLLEAGTASPEGLDAMARLSAALDAHMAEITPPLEPRGP